MGVAQQKSFVISDGVTGVFGSQNCGTYLTSALSVTPDPAFSAAVTPTTGDPSSVTISTTDTTFMGTTQTVVLQVQNQGFTAADSSGTYYLPTMTFSMAVQVNCRVYTQSPQITLDGIPTFDYFVYSGTITTPAFESLQKMNSDQTQFCVYDLTYLTSVNPDASALTLVINETPLTVSLSSTAAFKDTTQTVTVTSSLLAADNTKYVAGGWTYPNNGFQFIVNIKCTVVAIAFAAGPMDFTSTELRANVASAAFTASETPSATSCGYPFSYSYSPDPLPDWVTYNSVTRQFTIESASVAPTGTDRTETITMTATVDLPTGYVGTPPAAISMSITATLLACTVDSVQPSLTSPQNLNYLLKESSMTSDIVSSSVFSFSQTPSCGYPMTVTKTDVNPFSAPAVSTIKNAYQIFIQTNSYSDEGTHSVDVQAEVDPSKTSASYISTPLNFQVIVAFCLPSFTITTMPEDVTVYLYAAASETTNEISVVDDNSCGFDSLLNSNSLIKIDGSAAPAWTQLTLTTIPTKVSIGTFDSSQVATYLINIVGAGTLPDLNNTPIGFTSGTWTLTAVNPCITPNTFVSQNPTTMTVPALSNAPGQTQLLTEYLDDYGQSIGDNTICGARTYTAQYLDNGNNVWMGTSSGAWIDIPAGFPLQFDPTLMLFTLISDALNQETTLGAVSVRLKIGLSLFSTPILYEEFSFTITKCVVVSLVQNNVSAYTPATIDFSIQVPPIADLALTHTWTQTPNCLYPYTYQYTATACPVTNSAACTPGNNLPFLRTMSFAITDAEGVNVRPAAPSVYTEDTNKLFTNDLTQYGLYSVQITATLPDDPNLIQAQISSQMNMINICVITALIPTPIPETVQLFVGESSSFSFDALKNTQNLINPVPDCGELAVVALLDGSPVDWITVSSIGSRVLGNQVFTVKVDAGALSNALTGNLTVSVSLVNYPQVSVGLSTKLTIYKLVFGQMSAVKYQTNSAEMKVTFNYFLQPEASLPAFTTNAQVIAQEGISVTPYLPSEQTFHIVYAPPMFSFFNFQDANQNVGNYTIQYQIKFPKFPQQDQVQMFNLQITASAPTSKINTPPYFTVPNNWPYFKVLYCGDGWKYKIPTILDDNQGDSGYLATVDLKQVSSFVTFDYEKSEFVVLPDVITKQNNGEYKLSAELRDQNGGQSTYVISLEVRCNDVANHVTLKRVVESTQNSPLPFITKISGTGRVQIKFSEPLVIVNATNITNGTFILQGVKRRILGVHVIPEDQQKKINYTWECLNFTSQGMELQLYFDKPSIVSYQMPLDKLLLTFWGQPAFKATNRTDYVPYAYNITYNIPAQMDVNFGAALDSVLLNASFAAKMDMFGSFFIQVLVSGCLQQIFSLINKLQVIVHMVLVNVSIPATASLYFSYLFSILSFSLLPTDELYDDWFSLPQQEPLTSNFGQLGYKTIFFLRNLGTVSLFVVLWPLQISCAFILGKIKHRRAVNWSRKWKKRLIWRELLDYLEMQCVIITVSFLLNVIYATKEDWTNWGQCLNILMGIVIGGAVCLYPFFQLIMLHTKFGKIRNGNRFFKQRWGQMFDQLHIPLKSSQLDHKDNGRSTIYYVFYSKLRQIALAAGVVTLIANPLFCIFIFNFTTLFAIILAGLLRPFTLPSQNNLEMINEFAILVLNYHLMCCTNFVSDPETRDIVGYSFCVCISIILLYNTIIIGIDLFKQWCKKGKWLWKRRQMIKLHEEKRRMLLLLNEQYVQKIIDDYQSTIYGVKPKERGPPLRIKREIPELRFKKGPKNDEPNNSLSEIEEESVQNKELSEIEEVNESQSDLQSIGVQSSAKSKRKEQTQEDAPALAVDAPVVVVDAPAVVVDAPAVAVVGGADQLLVEAPVKFHKLKQVNLTEAKVKILNQGVKVQPNPSIQWMEDRVRNLPRVTLADEEMYWAERQKLSVMRAKNSPFITTEIL